jgi:hypothetical protein
MGLLAVKPQTGESGLTLVIPVLKNSRPGVHIDSRGRDPKTQKCIVGCPSDADRTQGWPKGRVMQQERDVPSS